MRDRVDGCTRAGIQSCRFRRSVRADSICRRQFVACATGRWLSDQSASRGGGAIARSGKPRDQDSGAGVRVEAEHQSPRQGARQTGAITALLIPSKENESESSEKERFDPTRAVDRTIDTCHAYGGCQRMRRGTRAAGRALASCTLRRIRLLAPRPLGTLIVVTRNRREFRPATTATDVGVRSFCKWKPLKTPGWLLPGPCDASLSNPWKLSLCEFVKFSVQQRDTQLHNTVCSRATPAHMLALAHSAANDSVNRRLDEACGDSASRTLPCAIVNQRVNVVLQIGDYIQEVVTCFSGLVAHCWIPFLMQIKQVGELGCGLLPSPC